MIHFGTFSVPGALAANTFYIPGYQIGNSSGSYVFVATVPSTLKGFDSSGNPAFYTPTQVASQLSGFFDAAGTSAAGIAALISTAPGTLDTLAEIDAQMASDESAAAAMVTSIAGKVSLTDARMQITSFSANLGTTARRSGKIFLSGLSGLSTHTSAVVWQSAAPGTGKGTRTDGAELEQIQLEAVIVNDTSMRLHWMANGPVLGNFNFFYQLKN